MPFKFWVVVSFGEKVLVSFLGLFYDTTNRQMLITCLLIAHHCMNRDLLQCLRLCVTNDYSV